MSSGEADFVKQQVAAHWGRRAPGFDAGFGHSISTAAERAAWDRIFDLVLPGHRPLDALDAGCGTGFLSFELAARGHRVTGVDFAPAMLAEARRKATERAATVRFEEADAAARIERLDRSTPGDGKIENAVPGSTLGGGADTVAKARIKARSSPAPMGGDLLLD